MTRNEGSRSFLKLAYQLVLAVMVFMGCGDVDLPIGKKGVVRGVVNDGDIFLNNEGVRCQFADFGSGPDKLVCCGKEGEYPIFLVPCHLGMVAVGCLPDNVEGDNHKPDDQCTFYGNDGTVTECSPKESCRECADKVTWKNGAQVLCQ